MSYTALALLGVAAAVAVDLVVLRVRLLRRAAFWTAEAIIVFFQLLTNGWLTGREIVVYDPAATLSDGALHPFGDWRLLYAPVEDLLFGLALVLLTLDLWVWWGARGVQRLPHADGPWARRFRPEACAGEPVGEVDTAAR